MTSKNSFWASMKENNKRRLWVWLMSVLLFVLVFPTYTALTANQITSGKENLIRQYGSEAGELILRDRMISAMTAALGFSFLVAAMITVAALVCAVQGFSYLYSRKKIDFYMGMPVKRKKRFFIIWLNGILIYLLPYLAGFLISMLIAAANGGLNGSVVQAGLTAFGVHLLFYLGVYHMAILAVMLTGNVVITGFGFLIFCLYELMIRGMTAGYQTLFFRYYSYYGKDVAPRLSPFYLYFKLAEADWADAGSFLPYLAGTLLFALVLFVIGYLCYLKRPAEAAGRAMTFEITKPVVKILVTVPVSLLAGLLISEVVNIPDRIYQSAGEGMEGIGYMIFVIALVAVIGSALMQVIYEFDIKGIFHKKYQIVICGLLSAVIFLIFRYDLTGYDSYIPDTDKVESVAFVPDYYEESPWGGSHLNEDGTYMNNLEYADRYMKLTDAEAVCELAASSMADYEDFLSQPDCWEDTSGNNYWSDTTLIYRMKSGRSISRNIRINVNDPKNAELLDRIMGSDEFKEGYLSGASKNLDMLLAGEEGNRKVRAYYGNNVYQTKLNKEEALEFLQIYRKDLKQTNFSRIKESTPVGFFGIEIEISGNASYPGGYSGIRSASTGFYIYPFYEESLAWLKEKGCYMEHQFDPEDVERIHVRNYNSEEQEKLLDFQYTADGPAAEMVTVDPTEEIDTNVYADYSGAQEIAEIAESVITEGMCNSSWDGRVLYESDYEVYVYFKPESDVAKEVGNYGTYYLFRKGKVPEFVEKDTKYQP